MPRFNFVYRHTNHIFCEVPTVKLCMEIYWTRYRTSQEALNSTLTIITESIERATWLTPTDRDMMRGWISEDAELQADISLIKQAALLADEDITHFFSVFMEFKRFWRDDLHGEYKEFMEGNSCLVECANKVGSRYFLVSVPLLPATIIYVFFR